LIIYKGYLFSINIAENKEFSSISLPLKQQGSRGYYTPKKHEYVEYAWSKKLGLNN
jgi:hypothetical protein